jgi:winged helix DNA-binding protein
VATSRGALCFGPERGRRTTYTSPRRWLPGFRPAAAGEAVPWLVRRFLWAYGPATPAQFARWLGAPAGWASVAFAGQPDVEEVDFDGVVAVRNAGDDEATVAEGGGVRLLPYFDAYLIGCRPRSELFPGRAGERALNGGQAGNVPALLVDGRVAGVWHQRRSGRRISVTVETLEPLSRRCRSRLDAEVRRIGHILEGTPSLTLGKVTVGAHA